MYRDMIVFIAGPICSGKTYESDILADAMNFDHVEISTIVRQLLDTNKRNELQGHPELSTQIIDRIAEIKRTTRRQGVVVSGPRQVEILKAFPEAELIWMNTPLDTCFERFYDRKDEKDEEWHRDTFEEYVKKDNDLGLQEVKQYMEKEKI